MGNPVYIFAEDKLSLACAKKVVHYVGRPVAHADELRGQGNLRKNLRRYNDLARRATVLVVTDLDHHECAPSLMREWTKDMVLNQGFLLRFLVREVEAWLFGHRESFASFLGFSDSNMPVDPESVPDPRAELFRLVKDKSRNRQIKDGLLPAGGSRIGPRYNSLLTDFVESHFDLEIATSRCDSLDRVIRRLSEGSA